MGEKKVLNVDDAYALETPEDSVRLYSEWAPTYDTDFVDRVGYVLFRRVLARAVADAPKMLGLL